MNFDDLPQEIQFLLVTIGQAAVSADLRGIDKEFFLKFCEEIWNTMKLNGTDEFHKILLNKMAYDIGSRLRNGAHDAIKKMREND